MRQRISSHNLNNNHQTTKIIFFCLLTTFRDTKTFIDTKEICVLMSWSWENKNKKKLIDNFLSIDELLTIRAIVDRKSSSEDV